MTLVIHAPNVHQGGGETLLSALLDAVSHRSDVFVILDKRMTTPFVLPSRVVDTRVPPTIRGRLDAEKRLRALAVAGTIVLCFGNLPPLFRCPGRTLLFLQNRYLLESMSTKDFPWRVRLRITAERYWLRNRVSNIDEIIVQSHSMAGEVARVFGRPAKVLPFAPKRSSTEQNENVSETVSPRFDFVYIASGEPHKNHERLLEAWRILAKDGIRPSLALTVDPNRFPELTAEIERAIALHRLHIENIGHTSSPEMHVLYKSARSLIYPSLGESFGLPLIEARALGLPVVAAERDYVRDVIEPVETFDPYSPLSIARAVRRFLQTPQPVQPILTPERFLESILSG